MSGFINGTAGADSIAAAGSNNGLPPLTTDIGSVSPGAGNDTVIGNSQRSGPFFVFDDIGNDYLQVGGWANSIGGSANSGLFGGQGNDTLVAGLGRDEALYGGVGNDLLWGPGLGFTLPAGFAYGANTALRGDDGNDTILGGFGFSMSLEGGNGADSILGTPNNDLIRGGNDADTVDAAAGFDTVFGENGDDRIVATADAQGDLLDGGFGNDTILAGGGNDLILGGDGNDSIDGGGGYDIIVALGGNNTVDGGDGGGEISAGIGSDLLIGGSGFDSLSGGDGNNTLIGGSSADRLIGGFGNDSMVGGTNGDPLDGGDYIDALGGNNTILGGGDNDYLIATSGNDLILGEDGNDRIEAGDGANTLSGGLGNDNIFAGFGSDSITGGDGNDVITAGTGNNTLYGGAGNDGLYALSGADLIYGEDGDDFIDAGAGANTVSGGSGNDNIYSGGSADSLMGGDGDDLIDAGTGTNTVSGGAGNDNIYSGGSADSLAGGAGNDSFIAASGADTVLGEAGDDFIDGGEANDRLDGGLGNDIVNAGGGADTVIGGAGRDRHDGGYGTDQLDYSFMPAGSRVFFDLQFGYLRVVKRDASGVIGIDTVQGFESYVGTAGDDKFIGWGQDETFTGGAGNDTFDGNDGFDAVDFGVAGVGNVNANLLTGIASDGLGGTDRFRKTSATNSSIEILIAGAGADTLIGDADNNTIQGGLGADSLVGGAGFDMLDYLGDSTVAGIFANLGSTTVGTVAAGTVRDAGGSIDTVDGFENIRATDLADTLIGNDDSNALRGLRGADRIDGGLGHDFVDYRSDADGIGGAAATLPGGAGDGFGVVVNLSDTAVTIAGFGAEPSFVVGAQRGRDGTGDTDTLVGIESARGSNLHDVLIGTSRVPDFTLGRVRFYGEDRSNLIGRLGDDTLRAIDADDGAVASYRDDISGVVARLDLGNTILDGYGTTDTLINISAVEGSDFDDLIVAGAAGSWMRGRAGEDTLIGGAGFDVLLYSSAAHAVLVDLRIGSAQDGDGFTDSLGGVDSLGGYDAATAFELVAGGDFADTLIGHDNGVVFLPGPGADSIIGGAGQDVVSYYSSWRGYASSNHTNVYVNLNSGIARDGDGSSATGSVDRLFGIEHAVGSYGDDTLTGSGAANTLMGAEGNDTLAGGSGDDVLEGGAGADTLNGGAGIDTASYASSASGVNVDMRITGPQLGGGDGAGDLLLSMEHLIGSEFNDTLVGDTRVNSVSGGAGNDLINGSGGDNSVAGGAGRDTLLGGVGKDQFLYLSPDEGQDRLTDFVSGQDVIALSGAAFGGLPAGPLGLSHFAIDAPTDADDVLIYVTATRLLRYDADGSGAGAAVSLLQLTSGSIGAGDIIIV